MSCHCSEWSNKKLKAGDYDPLIKSWKNLESLNKIQLIVGSCKFDDLSQRTSVEELIFVYHYIKCSCGKLYRSGAFCRGLPFVEQIHQITRDAVSRTKTDFQVVNAYNFPILSALLIQILGGLILLIFVFLVSML